MGTIKLDHITKIEGHAKLNVKVRSGKVQHAKLEIYEGARFFEEMIKGRHYRDVSTTTSRICGVCSQAHTIAALYAVEKVFGIKVSEQTNILRELLVNAGMISSHVLHLYFLALSDYFGYESTIALAKKKREEVKDALFMKQVANDVLVTFGGREVHSPGPTVGGFFRLPQQDKVNALLPELEEAKKTAMNAVKLFANLKYPKFERDCNYIALQEPGKYPFTSGHLVSSEGLKCSQDEVRGCFKEYHNPYATAEFVVLEGKSYMVGALARINLNREWLSEDSKKVLKTAKVKWPSSNPFHNNIAQAVELVHLFDKCIEIIKNLKIHPEDPIPVKPKAGTAIAVNEAPRGSLIHEYAFNKKGFVVSANVTTPTSQSLRKIEEDIKLLIPSLLKKNSKDKVVLEIEKLIRAYDPCISCSTHFLDVKWE